MNYRVGSTITYKSYGEQRCVTVSAKYPDIKNGRPGFDGVMSNPDTPGAFGGPATMEVWGYDYQITSVVQY